MNVKKMVGQKALVVVAALLFVFSFAGCKKTPTGVNELKIGVLLPLTGDNASYGVDCKKGMELAIEEYQKSKGAKVSATYEDTKADPKAAVTAANKLISIDKVNVILGDMFSATTIPVAPLAQKNGILLITPTAAATEIPAAGDHVFTIYPTADYEGKFVADYAAKHGFKTFGIITQQVDAAIAMGKAFDKEIKSKGGTVVFQETIQSGENDFRTLLAKHKNDMVDAIFVSAYREEACRAIQQSKESGIKTQFLSQSSLYDQKTLTDYGQALQDVVFSAPYFNDTSNTENIKAFRKAFSAKFGAQPNVWSAYGYDVVSIALQGYNESQKAKQPIQKVMVDLKFNGVTGPMVFYKDRTANKTMQMFTIKDTKFVPAK